MNFWRFCEFLREFLLKIHKAWLVFRLKIAFDKLGRPLRFQSSLRLPKTIFRPKYCALNFLTENSGFRLNFRFFSGVFYEFLHKFRPKFVIASLFKTHAVRSPLPCGGGWGWVLSTPKKIVSLYATNPTPSRTKKCLCVAKFAPKFHQNSAPAIFGVR